MKRTVEYRIIQGQAPQFFTQTGDLWDQLQKLGSEGWEFCQMDLQGGNCRIILQKITTTFDSK